MATTEVKKLWAIMALVLLAIVALLIVAVTSGNRRGPSILEPLTLSQPVVAGEWTAGLASSSVAVVEYSDFQCPACATYAPVVKQLIADYGDRISVTYRHFPLAIHPNATAAAAASEAAGLQGKFWEMADVLFERQADWSATRAPEELFLSYAQTLGLSVERFAADLNSTAVKQAVADDLASANATGLSHTPTFFINGQEIDNPKSYDEFSALAEAALGSTSATTTAR